MNNIAHDLFLLMASLMQLQHQDRMLAVFTEALNRVHPDFSIAYQAEAPAPEAAHIDICTAQQTYGYFRLTGDPHAVSPEFPDLLQNSVRMLAVFLEKLAEGVVKESDANFRTFFNTIPDFLFILDEQGNIQEWNQAVSQRLGYTPDDLLNKPVLCVHPEHRRRETAQIVEAMIQGKQAYCPIPLITRTGDVVPVETSITKVTWNGKPALFVISKDMSALTFSEEKFSKLFYLNPSACGISDAESGRYIEVNDAFFQVFGVEKQEVLGKTAHELGILTQEARQDILQKADEHGRISNIETTLHTKNGKVLHVLLSAENIYLYDKKYRYTIVHDITERKRAEEALAQSEKKFRTITEQMSDMVFVTDAQGVIIHVSPAARDIFGIAPADMEGRHFMEFLVESEIANAMSFFTKTITTGFPSHNLELAMKRADGSVLIGELNATFYQQDGLGRTVGLIRDITERKRMEQALRESEEHYRTLFEVLPIPAFTKNRAGEYTSCNAENQRYWAVNSIGRTDAELLSPEIAAALRETDLLVMATGKTLTIEEYFTHTPLGARHVVSRKAPLHDGRGEIVGILGASLDITDRKQMEETLRLLNEDLEARVSQRTADLEAVNQELREFAYIVSHDLKAPLRGIYQLARWLYEDYANILGVQGQARLDLLASRIKRMDALIDGILRYSRATHGSERAEAIDLNTLVPQVIEMLTPPAHITIRLEHSLPIIHGNPVQITQVFQNLLNNAVKFMDKPAGQITVGCEDAGDVWTFWVEDNGSGIEQRHHARIFQIFQSCDPRNEHESTGIGLTVVKKIVELYGGRIWVESAPGRGSRFLFTWPKYKDEQEDISDVL